MSRHTSRVIPIKPETSPTIENGVVTAVADEAITVQLAEETVKAEKAFSCIVAPVPKDTVLCCRNNTGEVYILAIVSRPDTDNMKLSFPSEVTLEAAQGNLNVFSGKSLTMAADNLNSFSRKTVQKSEAAYLAFDEVTATGRELQASYKTVRLISNFINTMARQVIDKFKGYVRHTEDHDQVQAGQLTRRTDGLYSMDSKNTVMISKKETKIDGEKIYMA